MERKLTELEKVRRDKIEKLKEIGQDAWSREVSYSDKSNTLKEKYDKYSKEELHDRDDQASVIGRVVTKRGPFVVCKDVAGQVQAYIAKKEFPKVAEVVELVDLGDIVRFEGKVMKTNTGEITIRATKFDMITKSLRPMPEKFHGIKDVEEKYRRRYLDLLMNEETVKTFWTRTKIISEIRRFFDDLGYMEADTPVLQPILGGASARPFETFHNALGMDFYLRIATELPLKKLLVGGIERVYEIGRIFRNEGIDTTHNPEFSSIEFYEAYSNLEGMMKRTEDVFIQIAKKLGKEKVNYNGHELLIKAPFARVNMVDAVSEKTGEDFREISLDKAIEIAKKHRIKIEKYFTLGHVINELFEELVESTLIQPTFVTGHPIEISPLAAIDKNDERFTDRAELFIDGREYANMFTELNDPIDQLERFEAQLSERENGNDEANKIDMDFVEALEYGMPPAGGCGIGIDRLVMLFTEKHSIREILLFPHLKNKVEQGGENE